MKQLLKSKTVQIALAQALVGVAIVMLTEADLAGYAVMLKSVFDIIIRSVTTEAISEK